MSLIKMLAERGGFPGGNEAARIQGGGGMSPMRGHMPWNSGFEGYNRNVLQEIMKLLQMRQEQAEAMANRHTQIPVARFSQGSNFTTS